MVTREPVQTNQSSVIEERETKMNYEAAMIQVRKPGYFSKASVRRACDFIINNPPPAHIRCDHNANVSAARVVSWAMGHKWQCGE